MVNFCNEKLVLRKELLQPGMQPGLALLRLLQ